MDEALMGDYRECESRHDCDDVSEELAEAKKEIERLRALLERAAVHLAITDSSSDHRLADEIRAYVNEQLPHAEEG
jgi:uncharacterized membrane protein